MFVRLPGPLAVDLQSLQEISRLDLPPAALCLVLEVVCPPVMNSNIDQILRRHTPAGQGNDLELTSWLLATKSLTTNGVKIFPFLSFLFFSSNLATARPRLARACFWKNGLKVNDCRVKSIKPGMSSIGLVVLMTDSRPE